jgi:hypothetical protein
MPTTWTKASLAWTAASYTWSDFSLAYELFLLRDVGGRGTYRREQIYADFFKDRTKKKRVIELIMKVKSNKIQQKVEIPLDTKIALSDIDMVIQEVLQKPTVNINVA